MNVSILVPSDKIIKIMPFDLGPTVLLHVGVFVNYCCLWREKIELLSLSLHHRFCLIHGSKDFSSEGNEINQLQRLFYLVDLSCYIATGSFQSALLPP